MNMERKIRHLVFSPIDIIKRYNTLLIYCPDKELWEATFFRENQFQYFNFLELKALFDAYKLGCLKNFDEGEFILHRNINEYTILVEKAKKEFGREMNYYFPENVRQLFKRLLNYRLIIDEMSDHIVNFNMGVIDANGLFGYSVDLTQQFNNLITDNIKGIDEVLSIIISPEKLTYNSETLIDEYNFPAENLYFEDRETNNAFSW
jgi:hypothetical protein